MHTIFVKKTIIKLSGNPWMPISISIDTKRMS